MTSVGEANWYGRDFFRYSTEDEQLLEYEDDSEEEVVDDRSSTGDDETPAVLDFDWRPINEKNQ